MSIRKQMQGSRKKGKPKHDFALEEESTPRLKPGMVGAEFDDEILEPGGEVLSDDEFTGLPFAMRNRHGNYPWEQWLDGKPRRIRRTHEDEEGVRHAGQFECTVKSMNVAIRREAGKRSLRCSIYNESENSIVFRVFPQNSGEEEES